MSRQGTWKPRTTQNIKAFWEGEANEWGDDPRVTIRDHYFRLLCLQAILKRVEGRHRLLDVGCGSGFGILFYSAATELAVGTDYVPSMIKNATRLFFDLAYRKSILNKYYFDKDVPVRNNVVLLVGDITNIAFPENFFDALVCERVIVNLSEYEAQYKAVQEISRVLDRGGVAAIAEASVQGHEKIDSVRASFGLAPMEKYWHNTYIQEETFIGECHKNGLKLEETIRFETYQFLSKVVYPRVIAPLEPEFLSAFNLAAYNVAQEFPDYDSVKRIGLASFLREIFLPELRRYDQVLAGETAKLVESGLFDAADFARCSHQVLFTFEKI